MLGGIIDVITIWHNDCFKKNRAQLCIFAAEIFHCTHRVVTVGGCTKRGEGMSRAAASGELKTFIDTTCFSTWFGINTPFLLPLKYMLAALFRALIIIVCFLLLLAEEGLAAQAVAEVPGQIWQVGDRRWNVEEQQRYTAWVEQTVTEDFFLQNSIPIDCADVPYGLHWIYARIAHLPAAATLENGQFFGHWSTAWSNLPTAADWQHDRRFRASLLFLLANTSTRTMPEDTFPIHISRNSVQAGTVFIGDGHAGIVGRIVLDGSTFSPIQTWEATLPGKVQKMRQESYFSGWPDLEAGSGVVWFRWPELSAGYWRYPPKQEQPFYSLEQYGPNFNHYGELFDEAVARQINSLHYAPALRVQLILDTIHKYLQARAPLVNDGYLHCRRGNCPEGSFLWELYSTPSRDDMIAFEIEHLLRIIKNNNLDQHAIARTMDAMVINVSPGWSVSMGAVVENYRWLSHDPSDPLASRWGINKCSMILSRTHDILKNLDFIERKYRTADPKYADFERGLRLEDINQLQEDGRQANCQSLAKLPLR